MIGQSGNVVAAIRIRNCMRSGRQPWTAYADLSSIMNEAGWKLGNIVLDIEDGRRRVREDPG